MRKWYCEKVGPDDDVTGLPTLEEMGEGFHNEEHLVIGCGPMVKGRGLAEALPNECNICHTSACDKKPKKLKISTSNTTPVHTQGLKPTKWALHGGSLT